MEVQCSVLVLTSIIISIYKIFQTTSRSLIFYLKRVSVEALSPKRGLYTNTIPFKNKANGGISMAKICCLSNTGQWHSLQLLSQHVAL